MSYARILVLTVLLACVAAQAQTQTLGPLVTTTPIPSTKTDWAGTLAFPQFNPALGTLQSVELKISASYDTVLTITNSASSASNGWAKTELLVSVQDAGNNLVEPVLDLLTPQYNFSLNPGESITSGTLTKTGNSDDIYTSAAVLAAFSGLGSVTLNAATTTYAVISYTGGNTEAVQSTYASATGTVTYTYLIPEPASLSLLGLTLVGLVLRRR